MGLAASRRLSEVFVSTAVLLALSAPEPALAQEHVHDLMEGVVVPLHECLARVAPDDETAATVVVRVEFPSKRAPTVVSIAAEPDSPVDRCVRAALAFVTVPAYQGPLTRAECDLPLTAEAEVQCSPGPSGPLVSAPSVDPPSAPPAAPGAGADGTVNEPATPTEEGAQPPNERAGATPDDPGDEGSTDEGAASGEGGDDGGAGAQGASDEAPTGPPRPRPNNVTLNVLGVVIGGFSIAYSRALRHVSIGVGLLVQIPVILDGVALHGELDVLAWPSARLHSGFFGGVSLHVGQVLGSPDHIQVTPSLVLGWRFLFRNGVNIGLGAAVGYGFMFSECRGCESTGPLITFEPLDEDGNGGGLYVRAIGDVGIAF